MAFPTSAVWQERTNRNVTTGSIISKYGLCGQFYDADRVHRRIAQGARFALFYAWGRPGHNGLPVPVKCASIVPMKCASITGRFAARASVDIVDDAGILGIVFAWSKLVNSARESFSAPTCAHAPPQPSLINSCHRHTKHNVCGASIR